MNITILGSGNVGRALGNGWKKACRLPRSLTWGRRAKPSPRG
jgi:predicted dinucleotide-binding enzyme